jgi:hypothetical protein
VRQALHEGLHHLGDIHRIGRSAGRSPEGGFADT